MAIVQAPFFFASRSAASVSAVSPTLRDHDGERVLRDDGIAISELGPVVDLDRQAREILDQELADESRVPGRAARQDDDALERAEPLVGDLDLVQEHPARLDRRAAEHRLPDRPRLLEDLLEHEMLEPRLLRHDGIP